MGELVIRNRSEFVVHGFVWQVGAGWKSDHTLMYHTCIISEGTVLKYAVAFAQGTPFRHVTGLSRSGTGKCGDGVGEDSNGRNHNGDYINSGNGELGY